ncbi:COG4648 family protein [Ideonella paludis]|uniref:COG4648 family protein n=1 Tax=Ideonella paludis TaxID=1233411 RepID=UPI00363E981C
MPLKLYPVWVNAVLLLVFGWSLWRGPPVIEQLARLSEPELPPRAVAYTRQVTQVWCGFFVLNGSVAAYTALACNEQTWAIYNGVVAYVLMGLLFGIEWCVRQRVKASVEHG